MFTLVLKVCFIYYQIRHFCHYCSLLVTKMLFLRKKKSTLNEIHPIGQGFFFFFFFFFYLFFFFYFFFFKVFNKVAVYMMLRVHFFNIPHSPTLCLNSSTISAIFLSLKNCLQLRSFVSMPAIISFIGQYSSITDL